MNSNGKYVLVECWKTIRSANRYFGLGQLYRDPNAEPYVTEIMGKSKEDADDSGDGKRQRFESLCRAARIKPRIGFVGGGNMAQALASGLLSGGLVLKENITAADPDPKARHFWNNNDLKTVASVTHLFDRMDGDILVLAVKPPQLAELYDQLKGYDLAQKAGLLVSVCAGATIKTLQENLTRPGSRLPLVRVMPNTPSLVGCGASVFSAGPHCASAHGDVVQSMMETVGICSQIGEKLIDAVTGLSASGPAYIYTVVDAMSDGGVKMGLPRDLATRLAAQTVMGAAQMVLKKDIHPGNLKNQVCSPGGTTIAGIHVLEEAGIRAAFISAVEVATLKARELGQTKT